MSAREWNTDSFWIDRIGRYLAGEHHPQKALAQRGAFVATDGAKIVDFIAGHLTRRLDCAGELQWVNVIGECRGARIGERLISRIGEWVTEQGCGANLRQRRPA